jgi:hypothetical protein
VTDEPEPRERKPVLIGTGMPQSILLQAFGQWIRDAFGHTAYQVGSSVHGKEWRDVDVRLILDDDEFHALFPGYKHMHQIDAKWSFMCAAISALGKQQTGLPIDFQMQPMTEANKVYGGNGKGTFRQPLFFYDHASVQAEIKRRAEAEDARDAAVA